ncbi:MAG: ATP-binding cassette domain-containing protein, partial [Lachnospiraceae bacterium]|nr:ATP-binding cassette domain-containing protein [Lachnospiraceae bacterium]
TKEEQKRAALEWLNKVELEDVERVYDSYPHELSGGMRQRVMIAAAMVSGPRLLIADEPTTALDVTVQAQIIQLLKKINQKDHTAIMFISHDLSLVRQLCHRVIVMKDGRIVEEGECDAVFETPQEDYTKRLIAAIPRIPVS